MTKPKDMAHLWNVKADFLDPEEEGWYITLIKTVRGVYDVPLLVFWI